MSENDNIDTQVILEQFEEAFQEQDQSGLRVVDISEEEVETIMEAKYPDTSLSSAGVKVCFVTFTNGDITIKAGGKVIFEGTSLGEYCAMRRTGTVFTQSKCYVR